jgi:hypothetical protein
MVMMSNRFLPQPITQFSKMKAAIVNIMESMYESQEEIIRVIDEAFKDQVECLSPSQWDTILRVANNLRHYATPVCYEHLMRYLASNTSFDALHSRQRDGRVTHPHQFMVPLTPMEIILRQYVTGFQRRGGDAGFGLARYLSWYCMFECDFIRMFNDRYDFSEPRYYLVPSFPYVPQHLYGLRERRESSLRMDALRVVVRSLVDAYEYEDRTIVTKAIDMVRVLAMAGCSASAAMEDVRYVAPTMQEFEQERKRTKLSENVAMIRRRDYVVSFPVTDSTRRVHETYEQMQDMRVMMENSPLITVAMVGVKRRVHPLSSDLVRRLREYLYK